MRTDAPAQQNSANPVPCVPMGPPPQRASVKPTVRPFPPMARRPADSPPAGPSPVPCVSPVPAPKPAQVASAAICVNSVPPLTLEARGRRTIRGRRGVRRPRSFRIGSPATTPVCVTVGSLLTMTSLVLLAVVVLPRHELPGLHLEPIRDVVCTSGDRIVKQFGVRNAKYWRGRIEYQVHISGAADARIDSRTGRFEWCTDRPGRYRVTVTARTKRGTHRDQQSFMVLVKTI
jgi:hypothetical protein